MGLALVVMMFAGNTAFAADDTKPVDVIGVSANGGHQIRIGDEFELLLKLVNNSGGVISDVTVTFSSTASVKPVDSVLIKQFAQEVGNGQTVEQVFYFFHTGALGTELPMVITYKDKNGNTHNENDSIWISNLSQDIDPTTGDKGTFEPVLVVSSKAIPEGSAGNKIIIPLTITNVSAYEAKRVTIKPDLPDKIFVIDQMMVDRRLEGISAKKAENVVFQLEIDKNADADTYKVPIKITYTNIYGKDYSVDEEIYIKVLNNNLPPQLVVKKAVPSLQEIPEEQEFTVTFQVWNMGTLDAKNVTVELKPDSANFYVLDSLTKHYYSELKGQQSKEVTYTLKAKKERLPGTYAITVSLMHDNITAPTEYTMYVNVLGTKVEKEDKEEEEKKDDINIITENIHTPEGTVLVEQPFTASFSVKNTGTTTAESVKITVDGGDKILPRSLNVLNLTNVKPGESVPVAFSFVATKDSDSRTYPIKAVVEYLNNKETVRKEQYMGVLIANPEKDKEEEEEEEDTTLNTVPKIIISEYSTDPVMVNAGENFTLRMKFLNTNKVKAVENMKITLIVNESSEKTGSVFSPVQSSNTFYIAHLEPGQTSEKEMMMYTIPDAQAKTYVVKASFEYEYKEKDQLKSNTMDDLFGIPVVQPAKLETSDVIVSEPAIMGEPVYLSSEFYNMGKVTLSNLMVKVEGNFDTKESNYFVGNFEMGMSDYYEAPVTPLVPGETTGLLVFTFEDSAGKEHRIEKEFTVNAMESSPVINPGFPIDPNTGMPFDPGMMDPGMEGTKGPRLPIIPIAIGAGVVLLIVVFFIIRKRRKKRKEMMLDEDI